MFPQQNNERIIRQKMILQINQAAHAAANMTRIQYDQSKFINILSYDLARDAAKDRELTLIPNTDVIQPPHNVAQALLMMIDDIRLRSRLPIRHHFKPQMFNS